MKTKVRIKSRVVHDTLHNRDIIEMFHGILGTNDESISLHVVYPKYETLCSLSTKFIEILNVLYRSSVLSKFDDSTKERLGGYVQELRELSHLTFTAPDIRPYLPELPLQLNMTLGVEDFSKVPPPYWRTIPEDLPVDKKEPFLTGNAGLSYAPLPNLPGLNFKQIYISTRLDENDRRLLLLVLHKLLVCSYDVYKLASSPDVNVDEFVEVIKTSIEEVRRHLPRCEMAFDKILTSVDTFKENFEKYYHDYIVSNNPTSIMENFIFDVSKTSDLSPDMTRQFQQIIAYYRKLAPLQTADPRLQNLFHHVDKNIQELERNKFTMSETSTC
ncbi:hypothetical protein RirG_051150 [Rhizophagus irregularis DAOM 197198w]|uniref:Uncharacterized protein n=1 Tax=Rhizophagus irregularis (strain DAOM 197198w) TaxID=1432141 RepID=A0A015K497_RHIIW|nr:hypothetical protein RirG_060550 [Rhizophagus irregularis DAOM 197198w]EXX74435.1 hypothetical protein RirG_051150 [Rhizophagus irregularis DAOM 197198w]